MTAICQRCNQDMMDVDSCTRHSLNIGGTAYFRVKLGSEHRGLQEFGARCGDCNVTRGSLHHLHCDMEECPKCAGQLIACGCVSEFLPK
jgi:hypothetical protein